MAPLFSKADLNKFWHEVHNEVTLICVKFGEDLFSISKVIGRKTKWPRFFWPTLYLAHVKVKRLSTQGNSIKLAGSIAAYVAYPATSTGFWPVICLTWLVHNKLYRIYVWLLMMFIAIKYWIIIDNISNIYDLSDAVSSLICSASSQLRNVV